MSASKTVALTGLALLACAEGFSTPALSGLAPGRSAKACAASSLNMVAEDTTRRGALGVAAAGLLSAFAPAKADALDMEALRRSGAFVDEGGAGAPKPKPAPTPAPA
eukprot:CAMPEP_0174928236 /NCGR_PEP_ID=MMETSP1355-20121228/22809_1 /TAXON_ID=464990 /ORGANISM="Hemiselmis tepida, Strain CCMP443" /LENGTH=106 /DNA_ID=CAMNT_0016174385 /DNA_START=10 /DNA_END=327 /DNA_ORIENTATION=-